jgi:hypothetical protein
LHAVGRQTEALPLWSLTTLWILTVLIVLIMAVVLQVGWMCGCLRRVLSCGFR